MGLSNNLLMPLVLGKIEHNMEMEQAEVALKAADVAAKAKAQEERAQIGLKGEERRKTETHKSELSAGEPVKKQARIQQYEYAQSQFLKGVGPDPGPFTTWNKEQSRAGATNIGTSEIVKRAVVKKEALDTVAIQSRVRDPKFKSSVQSTILKNNPDFTYLPHYVQEETIFKEMDRMVKEAFQNESVVYDHVKGGWYNLKGKLLKKYDYMLIPKRTRSSH
jgi:hypothetical protein